MVGYRRTVIAAVVLGVACLVPVLSAGQGRGRGTTHHPAHPHPQVVVRGAVFIGGYFYDPVHGPYPWWPPGTYPHHYPLFYDVRAELRVEASPREAAVYVDGFYAGVVDDFDGIFQRLPLTPGGHEVVLYLEGFRTVRRHVYLGPGSTFHLRASLERLPPGERSEPPRVAPGVPPPPAGTYRLPPRPAPRLPAATDRPATAEVQGYGTLDLYVQPAGATVTIDQAKWASSDGSHFQIELTAGRHQLRIQLEGHRPYAGEVEIREGDVTVLNVSLAGGPR